MQKDFDLETILTITTGINLTDDFNQVFELAKFVFDDEFMNTSGLQHLNQPLKHHLLNIHPELNLIGKVPIFLLDSWIRLQKEKFGGQLSVCRIGEQLENDVKINKKKPRRNQTILA